MADLVNRNAPVPDTILGSEPTPAVSVGSLLRREGGEAEPDEHEATRGTVRGAVVRGATIVAGTALVAGSAFGGAVLVETFLLDPEPTAGAIPAASASDETPAATPGAPVDQAAAGPDAGTGPPTAWTEVAFPTAVKAEAGERRAAAPVTASPAAAPPARSTPAASAADQKEPDRDEPSKKEAASTAPTTADSTDDEPASSSGGTAKKDGGLVGTVVHAVTGVLGLG